MKTLTIFLTIAILSFTSCAKDPFCEKPNQQLVLKTFDFKGNPMDTIKYQRDCSLTPQQQFSYTWSKNQCSIVTCQCEWVNL